MKVTDEMVNRFLCWKIPDDFRPDFYISFDSQMLKRSTGGHWPTGTNLFTAIQAREMLEHVFGDQSAQAGAGEPVAWRWTNRWGKVRMTDEKPGDDDAPFNLQPLYATPPAASRAAETASPAAPSLEPTDAELERLTGEPHIDGWPLYSGLPPADSALPNKDQK